MSTELTGVVVNWKNFQGLIITFRGIGSKVGEFCRLPINLNHANSGNKKIK